MQTPKPIGTQHLVNRRTFLLTATAAAAACSPSAATPTGSTVSSGSTAPAAQSKSGWELEWQEAVEAAKREGALSVVTLPGEGYRRGLDAFQRAFPGIAVEHQSFGSSSLLIPKITQERDAGVYTFDVAAFSSTSLLASLQPKGVFDPVRPVMIRPDVTEDKNWLFGFESGFIDKEKRWVYQANANVLGQFWINTDMVKEGEIKSVKDLLDPKWKGKMVFADFRSGDSFVPMLAIRLNLGDEVLRRLWVDQQPVFQRTRVELVADMVRGKYAISLGNWASLLGEYVGQGVGKNVKRVALPEALFISGSSHLMLFNRAPHPAAAKVFINWVLTREAQEIWSKADLENSLRTDVLPVDPVVMPNSQEKYLWLTRQEYNVAQQDLRQVLEKMSQ